MRPFDFKQFLRDFSLEGLGISTFVLVLGVCFIVAVGCAGILLWWGLSWLFGAIGWILPVGFIGFILAILIVYAVMWYVVGGPPEKA